MKMSKSQRKAYKQGKADGYYLGYLKGFEDGNPFNRLAREISDVCSSIADAIIAHPEILDESICELNKESENDDENQRSF